MSRSIAIEVAVVIVSLLDQAYGDDRLAKQQAINLAESLLLVPMDPAPESQRHVDDKNGEQVLREMQKLQLEKAAKTAEHEGKMQQIALQHQADMELEQQKLEAQPSARAQGKTHE